MRPEVIVVLLAGCGPEVVEVSPAEGTALGGESVTLSGARLGRAEAVFFGEHRATITAQERDRITVTAPPSLAGAVAVEVVTERRSDVLSGAYTYLPLDPQFIQAAEHYLPDLDVALADGFLTGDGLMLLGEDGGLIAWESAGTGAFVEGEAPAVADAAGIAPVALSSGSALFVCHSTPTAPRLFLGLTELSAPLAPGGCTGARSADIDGDGVPEVIALYADGVRIWRVEEDALLPWSAETTDAASCGTAAGDLTCSIADGIATLSAKKGALTLPMPALTQADDGLSVRISGGPVSLTVTDSIGQEAHWQITLTDWQTLPLPAVDTWDEEVTLKPPLTALTLSLANTSAQLDTIVLKLDDGGQALIADFTDGAPGLEASAPADVLPVSDGVVIGGSDGLTLLALSEDATLRPAADSQLPDPGCPVGGLAAPDIEGDGRAELLVTCQDGQDRLLRSDGDGRWFDDTAATMPIDTADGRRAVAVDLDLDGLSEVVVASHGGVSRLYHADGARFEDWTGRLSLTTAEDVAVIPADVDDDGDLDLLLLGDQARLFVHVE